MSMIEPVGLSQVLASISDITSDIAGGGVDLLSGDGSFVDALAAAGSAQTVSTFQQGTDSPLAGSSAATATAGDETPSATLLGLAGQVSDEPELLALVSSSSGRDIDTAPGSTALSPAMLSSDLSSVPTGTGIMAPPAGLASVFATATAEYHLPPGLLEAVATQESGMDPSAVSSAGAEGIMQIMPATALSNGIGDPFDPTEAIFGAAKILAGNIAAFHSVPLALAAYNAGAGAVEAYGGIPPYTQTEDYVASIMAMLGSSA
jgi:hypothetical protein